MKSKVVLGTVVLIFFAIFTAPSHAREPDEMVRTEFHQILDIIGDTNYQNPEHLSSLRRELNETVTPLFDFRKMTVRTLGDHASELSGDELKQVSDLFKELLKNLYVDRLTARLANQGDQFNISDLSLRITGEQRKGNFARVTTVVRYQRGSEVETFTLNYRMTLDQDDKWRIYDVEIGDMSLVTNYRSQFNQVLSQGSVDKLIKTLRQKIEELN